jgi:hypothetical protein
VISKTARDASEGIIGAARGQFSAAGQNFEGAFGTAKPGSGPLATGLEIALAKSRLAAGQFDQAKRLRVGEAAGALAPAGAAAAARQEVKAVDSRSKEGIAEMFRLMRGETEDIQERQLDALERIADNTDDAGIDIEELSFAG